MSSRDDECQSEVNNIEQHFKQYKIVRVGNIQKSITLCLYINTYYVQVQVTKIMKKIKIKRVPFYGRRSRKIKTILLFYYKLKKIKTKIKIKQKTKTIVKKNINFKRHLSQDQLTVEDKPLTELNLYKQMKDYQNIILQKKQEIYIGTQSVHYFNIGLKNIGNTCYMNSVLQCLFKTTQLNQYKKGQCKLGQQYQRLCKAVGQNQDSVQHLKKIKSIVATQNSIFGGLQQNDAGEWFSTFIALLHDSLGIKHSQIFKINEQTRKSGNLVKLWREYILKDQTRCSSFIDDIFFGRYKTTYECLICKGTYALFQKFLCLYLPIPNKNTELKLQDCFVQFTSSEILKDENELYCNKCQSNQITSKKMKVFETNKIFVICLKRFTDKFKISKPIQIPFNMISHSVLNSKKQGSDLLEIEVWKEILSKKKYNLYAFINHQGQLNNGHYTATCLDRTLNQWIRYSDSHWHKLSSKQLRKESRSAYLLFYRLNENSDNET